MEVKEEQTIVSLLDKDPELENFTKNIASSKKNSRIFNTSII